MMKYLVLVVCMLISSSSGLLQVYMSPFGRDRNDGKTTQTPVQTLTRALELVDNDGLIDMFVGVYASPKDVGLHIRQNVTMRCGGLAPNPFLCDLTCLNKETDVGLFVENSESGVTTLTMKGVGITSCRTAIEVPYAGGNVIIADGYFQVTHTAIRYQVSDEMPTTLSVSNTSFDGYSREEAGGIRSFDDRGVIALPKTVSVSDCAFNEMDYGVVVSVAELFMSNVTMDVAKRGVDVSHSSLHLYTSTVSSFIPLVVRDSSLELHASNIYTKKLGLQVNTDKKVTVDHCVFKSAEDEHSSLTSRGIELQNCIPEVLLTNTNFIGFAKAIVDDQCFTSGSSSSLIKSCEFSNGYSGLYAHSKSEWDIEDTHFVNMSFAGVDAGGAPNIHMMSCACVAATTCVRFDDGGLITIVGLNVTLGGIGVSVTKESRCNIQNLRHQHNQGEGVFGDAGSAVNIFQSHFENNTALSGAGVNFDRKTTAKVISSTFVDNVATNGGAALFCGDDCFVTFSDCTVTDNKGNLGAADCSNTCKIKGDANTVARNGPGMSNCMGVFS